MFTAFSTALSALNAASTAIDVVGNNLANLNTSGFKASSVEFLQLMSQSMGLASSPNQVGMGVAPVQTSARYTQGTLTNTSGPTDVALQGDGFFVLKDANNQTLYTRAGSFQIDASGNLVTATGEKVQGWMAVNGVLNPNGPIGNLSIPVGSVVPAAATTTMTVTANLNSAVATTDPGATFTAPIQVVDSQGSAHTLSITFKKTGTNAWSYEVSIPAADLKAGGTTSVAKGNLTFDGSGNLLTPDPKSDPQAIKITGLADGANDLSINWSLYDTSGKSNITQFAQASAVGSTTQNGAATGQIAHVSLQNGGIVVATYSNGQQLSIGQIAVASIANPQSLLSVGDNNLKVSATTAAAAVGAAGTAGRGTIVAGALESSNADMATEFTNLLSFERSYQAASRVINASDQLLQETVNLIHP